MRLCKVWTLWLLLLPGTVLAQGFASFNQSTFARSAVLPVLTGTTPLQSGARETSLVLDLGNETFEHSNGREQLLIDAESLRLSLLHRRGFAEHWQWSAELPLLFTGGGVLDSPIETWHGIFGLPNGNRDQRQQNRYRISYRRDGVTLVDLEDGSSGLGDARLGVSRELSEQWQLHALGQLPTGNKRKLRGGHAGLALWAAYQSLLGESERVQLDVAAGLSAADAGGPLADLQAPILALGSVALTLPLPLFDTLQGVLQLNAHSAPYERSDLAPLGQASVQFAFGLRYPWSGGALELGVQEDLAVNASPDFGVHLSVRLARGR